MALIAPELLRLPQAVGMEVVKQLADPADPHAIVKVIDRLVENRLVVAEHAVAITVAMAASSQFAQ